MDDAVRQQAGESITNALDVLELVYRHVEQILDTVARRLRTQPGLGHVGRLSVYKHATEGHLRLRRYEGRYLARDGTVWQTAQPNPDRLRHPILFVCAVTKPKDPARVGGMCVLGGTLAGFTIDPGKPLKGKTPDQHLPYLFDALMDEPIRLGDEPGDELDLRTRRVSGSVRYVGTRIVDLPNEGTAIEFADRIAPLWLDATSSHSTVEAEGAKPVERKRRGSGR